MERYSLHLLYAGTTHSRSSEQPASVGGIHPIRHARRLSSLCTIANVLSASVSLSLSAYDVFKIDIQTSAAVCVAVKPLQFKEKCLPFIANGVVIRIRSN